MRIKTSTFKYSYQYEEFALYLATEVYTRLISHPKLGCVDENQEPLLTPVKSCLNYMKAILYGRKVAWEQENYCQSLTETTLAEELMQSNFQLLGQIQSTIAPIIRVDINSYIKSIPKIIKDFVYKRFHERNNKVLLKNICISCLLSIINSISFTQKDLDSIEITYASFEARQRYLDKLYKQNRDTCIILYRVPEEYRSLVSLYVKEILTIIGRDLRELSNYAFAMPDSALFDIAVMELGGVLEHEY